MDWVYLAKKTHEGAEIMLLPDETRPHVRRKRKILKFSFEVLMVLFRLYF